MSLARINYARAQPDFIVCQRWKMFSPWNRRVSLSSVYDGSGMSLNLWLLLDKRFTTVAISSVMDYQSVLCRMSDKEGEVW